RPMKSAATRPRNDVRKSGRPSSNLRRHPAGARSNLLHRIYVEVREGRATHLRVADVGSVHREYGLHSTLTVDRKLLREVRSAVGIRHGPSGQQEQLTEITLVQWKL